MAHDTDKSMKSSSPGFVPGAFGEMGKKQMETAVEMQREFLDTMEQINRAWLARAQSEVTLASEFVGKLAAARSIPDAATVYQECMSRQMEILAEDSRRMAADGEKLMRIGTRMLANGSPSLGT